VAYAGSYLLNQESFPALFILHGLFLSLQNVREYGMCDYSKIAQSGVFKVGFKEYSDDAIECSVFYPAVPNKNS